MTQKERYEILGNRLLVADNETDKVCNVFGFYGCVNLLNEQAKEIERLKNELECLQSNIEETILEKQNLFAYVELLLIAKNFKLFDNEDRGTLVCPLGGESFSEYLKHRLEALRGDDNE